MKPKSERYTTGEKALTENEYEKLMAIVDNLEDECLFTVAISTGLRRFDVTNIQIANIHFNTDDHPGNWLTYNEKKKGNRIRTIPLNDKSVQVIKKLINTRSKKDKNPKLFSFNDRTAYERLKRACIKADIPQRPFHALRATCIKRCQRAGWTPEQVSALTGDTIAVIQEHYSTPSISEMREVVTVKSIL